MPQADPFVQDPRQNPYKCLGIHKNASYEEAKDALLDLHGKHQDLRDRHKNKNPKKAQRHQKAIENMKTALEAIEAPPEADQPVNIAVETTDPVVGEPVEVKVTGNGRPVETIVEATNGNTLQENDTTDPNTGKVTFTFDREGSVKFTALTTEPYDNATAKVSVDRRDASLAFAGLPDTVEVDETFDITVTAAGDVVDAVVSIDRNKLGRTTGGGLTHSFDSTGMYELTASKQPDEKATYEEVSTNIEITKQRVQLTVGVGGDNHEIDDEVVVYVREAGSGTAVPDADVTIGNQTRKTNHNGEARVPVRETGRSVTVKATKTATNGDKIFLDDKTTIEVSKQQAGIEIDDIEGKRMEQSTLTVHVTDRQGQPLEDASVTTDWGHDESTNNNGVADLELNDDGRLTITAKKENRRVDHGSVSRTLTIGEFTRELVIASAPDLKKPGETATIHVTDGAGEDVENATVTSSEQTGKTWTTDEDGKVSFSVTTQPGAAKITVKKNDDDFNTKETTRFRILR